MPSWKKVIVSGSDAILLSVTSSNGFFGTASYANNSATASYISTLRATGSDTEIQFNNNGLLGSYAGFKWLGDRLLITTVGDTGGKIGNPTMVGTDEFYLYNDNDEVIAGYLYDDSSFRYGNHTYLISGSKHIFSSYPISASNGITGSLFGTSSWATNVLTASYATIAASSSITFGSNNADYYLTYVPGGNANYPIQINANLPYNPSTRNLGATNTNFLGTSSFTTTAATASYTPNAIVTASVSLNTLTFTKGNGSTFNLTVDTGSGGGPGGGTPGGGQYDIQTNDGAGGFAGDTGFLYNSTDEFIKYENDTTNFGSTIISNDDVGRYSISNIVNTPTDKNSDPCKFRTDLIPWTISLPSSTNSIVNTFRAFAASLDPLRVLGFKCDYCLTLKDGSDYFSGTRVGTLMASWDYDTTYNPVIIDSSISGDQTYSVLQNPTFSLSWNSNNIELYLDNTTSYVVIFTGLFTVFNNKT